MYHYDVRGRWGGGYPCVGTGTYGNFLYFPLNFAVNPKNALKENFIHDIKQ